MTPLRLAEEEAEEEAEERKRGRKRRRRRRRKRGGKYVKLEIVAMENARKTFGSSLILERNSKLLKRKETTSRE